MIVIKNGITALNSTDGLTSVNGSGSTTIVYQRQIVEVPVATPVKSIMSQKASSPAIYEVLTISKNGKESVLKAKTINFNYYESLYSPVITANMMFLDAGGSTPDKKENLTSIKDGLPITALKRM